MTGFGQPLFERVLETDKATLGPDHADLALDMRNLADVYVAQELQGTHYDGRLRASLPTRVPSLLTAHACPQPSQPVHLEVLAV